MSYRGSTCPACGETIRTDHPHQHVTEYAVAALVVAAFVGFVVAATVLPLIGLAVVTAACALVVLVAVTVLGEEMTS